MNLVKLFIAGAVITAMVAVVSYSIADEASLNNQGDTAVVIVTVTKDAGQAVVATNVTPSEPAVAEHLRETAVSNSQLAPAPVSPVAAAADNTRLFATGFEAAVLADEGEIAPSPADNTQATTSSSGSVAIDAGPPVENTTSTDLPVPSNTTGTPVQVGIVTGQQPARACTVGSPECSGVFAVSVGDGLGGSVVLGQTSPAAASLTSTCSSTRSADFHTNADGSWTYSLNAGCVKKEVTVAP